MKLKTLWFRLVALSTIAILTAAPVAYGLTPQQRRDYAYRGIEFIDSQCSNVSAAAEPVTIEEAQKANARAVIGVAKTYKLGPQGALIGLMTALTESSFKNQANDGSFTVPEDEPNAGEQPYINTQLKQISESLPHEAVGNNYDSVGIMQQRPTMGWSTFGSEINTQVVGQLMTPAYAAQAFFGTPKDAQLPEGLANPDALQKGLQNIDNWQTLPPWVAAQQVQGSEFSDGSNYRASLSVALFVLNELWDSSPEVPLPVPVTGGSIADTTTACFSTGRDAILEKIKEYAWADYRPSGTSRALAKKPAYQEAVDRASYKGDPCYGGGVDCGAFVTIVMRESGADPNYNTKPECNTSCQLQYLRRATQEGKYTRVLNKNDLQPGDIAIRHTGQFGNRSGHTFFFVGNAIKTDAEGNEWKGESASASQCGRAPMASGTDTFELYEWYHLN